MSEWQPIETAPKDRRIDLWAYKFELENPSNPNVKKLQKRFPDCVWSNGYSGLVMSGFVGHQNQQAPQSIDTSPGWKGQDFTSSWSPSHWMPLPKPPESTP